MEIVDKKINQKDSKPIRIYFDPNFNGSHVLIAQGKKHEILIGRESFDEVIAALQQSKQSIS
jgi:hypothetical protein